MSSVEMKESGGPGGGAVAVGECSDDIGVQGNKEGCSNTGIEVVYEYLAESWRSDRLAIGVEAVL